jgi:hypothetical protein
MADLVKSSPTRADHNRERREGLITHATRTEKALKLARELVKMVPALDKPEYKPLTYNYCRLTILIESVFGSFDEGDLVDSGGLAKAALTTFRQLVGELRALAKELGISPTTSILLAKQVKPMLDIEAIRAEYAEADEE